MAQRSHCELDLLKRFLPTPYFFDVDSDGETVHIESNDLEIALMLRSRQFAQPSSCVQHWTIMRDYKAGVAEDGVTLIVDNDLRTLLAGRETILIFDRRLRKVLGFVGWIDVEYVASVLIPLLIAT